MVVVWREENCVM